MDALSILDAAGFDVIEATNADDAIEILKSRADISIVFTDVQMPNSMDSFRLAHVVRNRWPPVKIVATSGQIKIEDGALPSGSLFLPKPYLAACLLSLMRGLIDGAPPLAAVG